MSLQSNSTLHVMTRLPEFLRRDARRHRNCTVSNTTGPIYGRVDIAIRNAIQNGYSKWTGMAYRYRDIMTGRTISNPLVTPLADHLLLKVSRATGVPVSVMRDSGRRHPPASPIARARVLFAMIYSRAGRVSRSRIGVPLNLSASFGTRALAAGRELLDADTQFANTYRELVLDSNRRALSNLIL